MPGVGRKSALSSLPMTPTTAQEKRIAVPAEKPMAAPEEPNTSFRVIRLDSPPAAVEAVVPPPDADAPAPRRAVPLAPPTAKELAAAREIALAAARPRLAAKAAAAKASRPAIEKKIAGAADSNEMIQVIDVELALQRARRLSGAADKQREFLRVLSVLMLFGLVIAVVGAMWYLQTLKQGRANLSRQRPAAAVR